MMELNWARHTRMKAKLLQFPYYESDSDNSLINISDEANGLSFTITLGELRDIDKHFTKLIDEYFEIKKKKRNKK